MSNSTIDRDQADAEFLANEVSDEALEAASCVMHDGHPMLYTSSASQPFCVDC